MALVLPEAMMALARPKCSAIEEGASPANGAIDFDAATTASGSNDGELSPCTSVDDDFEDIDATDASGRRPLTWQLVWCSERCHKDENTHMRKMLRAAAAEAGAMLTCFKKANTFARWSARPRRPSYVLLTDWREVKPCLAAVQDAPGRRAPLRTFVLCADDRKVLTRASAWAEDCPCSDTVRVITDLQPFLAYLRAGAAPSPQASRGLPTRQQANGGSPIRSTPAATRPAPGGAQPLLGSAARLAPEPARSWAAAPLLLAPQQCLGASSPLAHGSLVFVPEDAPPTVFSAAPSAACGDAGVDAATALVQQVAASYGATSLLELDALLRCAAPEVYED